MVPSSNTTMETELPQLLASVPESRFSFHSARMRMQRVTSEELERMNEQNSRAAGELADLRPDVVATACLVAIMAQGPGSHLRIEREIRQSLDREGSDAPVISSAGALIWALNRIGAKRVAIVTPYMKPLTKTVADYIEDAGVEVHDALSLEVADNRAVGTLDPSDLRRHWRSLDVAECDAIVISACVQMPSFESIAAVEQESGLPTISAASATAAALLDVLGRRQPTSATSTWSH